MLQRAIVRVVLVLCVLAQWLLLQGTLPTAAHALIFASPEFEPTLEVPENFPYWDHVVQRRYGGPSVLYLGGGWAMTARHVGMGEIVLQGEIILPHFGSARTLLNVDGSAADILVFQLALDAELPDLPLLPLAKEPPEAGDEVLIIGFGKERAKVIEWRDEDEMRFGFEWSESGRKRWGTNRVSTGVDRLVQGLWTTRAIGLRFDPPDASEATTFEAHAAVGDSGGAVFVEREGEWLLVGMMMSISSLRATPVSTARYGDITYAADLSHYRSEVLRWTRSQCANEEDDDGDGMIDFPLDPDCEDYSDRDERDRRPLAIRNAWMIGIAALTATALGYVRARRQKRGTDGALSGLASD